MKRTCGLIVIWLGAVADPLGADDWTKEAKDRAKLAALHDREQRVRGDSGKWNDDPRVQHAPPIERKPAKVSLDDWADQLLEEQVKPTDTDDNWIILRTAQLDDNDRVWVERIEKRGRTITIVANQAKWQGNYFRNFTYYPVIGLNLGKLEAGEYEVKWIIQPLVFTKFQGDGKAVADNWPKDEQPAEENAVELQLKFVVSRAG